MTEVVLVPARNEGPRLPALLASIQEAMPHAAVWVVDGGSTDDTAAVANAKGALVLPQRGHGYADALCQGYAEARAQRVERLFQLDADGQHPAAALPLLGAALEDFDVVYGSRQGTVSPSTWDRRLGNRVLRETTAALAWSLGLPSPPHDVTTGMKALGPRALAATRLAPRDLADANVRLLELRCGLRIGELPVEVADRSGGQSMHAGGLGLANFPRSLGALVRAATQEMS